MFPQILTFLPCASIFLVLATLGVSKGLKGGACLFLKCDEDTGCHGATENCWYHHRECFTYTNKMWPV